ncbi:MAG: peptidoglycan DD-metalloendopeptidase family protein, partial [Bacteroidales bacterium]|nr:peptidoglycan DD-metalloendopeptidase family protein [Bacteroidales bacterium]
TSKLEQEQNSQTKTLNNLKNKESELKRKLQQQQQSANKLQREIEKLIAEEARRSSGGKSTTYVLTPSEKIISTNFANNKGRLPWPVEKGVITSRFGKQAHPVIKNITIDNAGVDISTNPGANVRAIFDGEVRSVMSMPGAQNIVIIRHGEYLSVYTHLMSVNVKVGDHVNTKQNIGKVYTDIDENKTILHLEVWFKEAKENPAVWLAK